MHDDPSPLSTTSRGLSRRNVIRGAATLGAVAAVQPALSLASVGAQPVNPAPSPGGPVMGNAVFFQDADFEFDVQNLLGVAWAQGADVGEALATVSTIVDGDPESWYQGWMATARRIGGIAETSEAAGHRLSAYHAWRRTATYYTFAGSSLDRTSDPSRLQATWELQRDAWDRAVDLFLTPVERIEVPYEGTTLPGYLFRAAGEGCAPAPLLVLVNGSDGSDPDMWGKYGLDAVSRGYHVLLVDGPGQQAALFRQGLYFRPDWEAVVTPSIDRALEHLANDVDADRIALLGCSQAGYWSARAAAFEPRAAALVTDPGVINVSEAWFRNLPPAMLELFNSGNKALFDQYMDEVTSQSAEAKATYDFRARPYGISSPFDLYTAVKAYDLTDVADQITCPTFVASPDGEQFYPGQPERLAEAIGDNATLVRFTAAEGAFLHCEPMACALRNQRIFDWLDEVLDRS